MSEHRLDKIVVERPRGGGGLKTPPGYKKALQKSNNEGRKYESLRRRWTESGHRKSFSDHLGPLRRLLRSKVGEHWDDVYSEICQRLDRNTVTGQHVISHVWDFVERYVEIINGVPYRKASGKYSSNYPLGDWREQLYVHPQTGILCLAEKKPKTPPKKRDDLLVADAYHQYRKLDGNWYLITLEDLPKTHNVTDIVLNVTGNYWTAWQANQEYGNRVYAASKKQCNKKQIKFILKQLAKS